MDAGEGTSGEHVMSVIFKSGLTAVVFKVKSANIAKLKQATNAARNEVLKTLTGSRSGKTYRVPGTKRTYTASAPGEPPAVASGRMKGDIRGKVVSTVSGTEGRIGTTLDYPRHLEKKMNRIWLALGMKNARSEIKRLMGIRWF